jgi:hypothetical protein
MQARGTAMTEQTTTAIETSSFVHLLERVFQFNAYPGTARSPRLNFSEHSCHLLTCIPQTAHHTSVTSLEDRFKSGSITLVASEMMACEVFDEGNVD